MSPTGKSGRIGTATTPDIVMPKNVIPQLREFSPMIATRSRGRTPNASRQADICRERRTTSEYVALSPSMVARAEFSGNFCAANSMTSRRVWGTATRDGVTICYKIPRPRERVKQVLYSCPIAHMPSAAGGIAFTGISAIHGQRHVLLLSPLCLRGTPSSTRYCDFRSRDSQTP